MLNKYLIFFYSYFSYISYCNIYLKIFKTSKIFHEGFLYKNLTNRSESLPVKFQIISFTVTNSFCKQMDYLDIHSLSFAKQLTTKQNYVIAKNCQEFNCDL